MPQIPRQGDRVTPGTCMHCFPAFIYFSSMLRVCKKRCPWQDCATAVSPKHLLTASATVQVPHSHVQIKMHFSTRYLFVLNQACTCLNCTLVNLQFAKLSNHKARLVVFFFSFFFNIEPFNQCSTCSARNNSVHSTTWTGLARAYYI